MFPSKLAEVHSAHHCPLRPHEAKDFLQVSSTSASSEGIFLFTLLFTIIHHQEKQHILGNHEEAKKMNFSTKMHKEQNPFVFPLLLNFPQKKTTHKQNRHTCIQILLSFPRNSRLLIASPDNYISSLLRQIMAQIVTQNSGSTGRKMCNLPLQAASGAIATTDFLASPSTMERCTFFYQSYFYQSHYLGPVLSMRVPVFFFNS